ncbi:P-loop containing nucleoside triphosphate hydrolase protein [Naematelia encephala]|uniref:p-loop containing nucleoside triphosphate hydrolase protein n=1 Tax=Naematelia encephala TaxID=71784 RepID=A0A1Y2AG16_9TREE|nr:P-loop containing nucleoside triphosphate hydrolase protein [Naematelia encephala]
MLEAEQNIQLVVTGETAAGKTFSTHHLLGYLLNILQPVNQSMTGSTLEIVKQAEVILEALGNASTTSNDSSSRFSKRVQVIKRLNDKAISLLATDEDFHHSVPTDKDRPLSLSKYSELGISHYAGNVIYEATGIVRANKVVVPDGLANLLLSSGLNVVGKISVAIASTQGQGKLRPSKVVRWLRCIRPAVPGSIGWSKDYVQAQLEITGVKSIIATAPRRGRYGFLGAAQEVLDRYCLNG